ncbi:hypothetical protein S7711_09355 [Stachybotrys chartarum IBT 7711]|uniref:Cytochrome P450 n=1 Tax=Stachybotrys chartarum (strain CBS 109288 / IBT 7711) TaxID=1280523 RepID=A0A084AYK2_STACB|nr:hypothetical protein S7711_09355 [Stachybotrys chartarum IBT 7711]
MGVLSTLSQWLTPSGVAAAAVAAVTMRLLVYRFITDPLRSIPGPEVTRWTDLHVRLSVLTGRRAAYVHSLHQKYGRVVRTGPHEVDISDVSAAREIHRSSATFTKTSFYHSKGAPQSMFSTRDPQFHTARRRLLGPCFAESSLAMLEPNVLELVRRAVEGIGREAKITGSADVLKWWTLMAMDVIGDLSFGESFGMVERGQIAQKTQFAEDVGNLGAVLPLRTAFPWLIMIGSILPIPLFKDVARSRQRIIAYNSERVARYMKEVQAGTEKTKKTLFASLMRSGSAELSARDLTIEVQSYIAAGTDTTAVTATYLVWAVCRDRKIQETLVQELKSLPADIEHKHVRNLPYLNHVVEEALRRYGAAPGSLPRDVPVGGATLAGTFLPHGIVVSTQGYSIHRDSSIFPDPERFDPGRWENPTKEMKDASVAFGTGPRGCIGVHLARMELRLAAAMFFRAYPNAKISTQEGMSDADMEETISFLLMPKGHRCLVEVNGK